ncbi:MAG: gliding motility protein GldN [Bacteroidales bacterium]|nr:gliding motility protein GldN [Bacteroidales bacterium]
MGDIKMVNYSLLPLSLVLLFVFSSTAQPTGERPNNSFYEHKTIRENRPVELAPVREADVFWSKRIWQNIDVRLTMNQPLYFPEEPSGDYRSLMKVLEDAIREGKIRAYDVDDEHFRGEPLDPDELFERLSRSVTFMEDDQEVTVDIPFNPAQVIRFRIKEEWFIDKRRSQLDVRIIGLSPAREAVDEITGEFLGFEPLFWLPFAEIREVLATAPVYMRHNDKQQLSFDDFFIRRFFDATIYREDRPDNRVISEYIEDPHEQLLEAQRIKEQIRNMELDMWHY